MKHYLYFTVIVVLFSVKICLANPAHEGVYIDPTIAGCADETTCEVEANGNYYNHIGAKETGNPTISRGNFLRWKTTHGLNLDPTTPNADELRATYFNNADLKFGRDMHCRIYSVEVPNFTIIDTPIVVGPLDHPTIATHGSTGTANPKTKFIEATTACYVTNYGALGGGSLNINTNAPVPANLATQAINKALYNNQPIASVAMEVTNTFRISTLPSIAPNCGIPGIACGIQPINRGEVKFFIFSNTDTLLDGAALDSETNLHVGVNGVADHVAANGNKANPGVCLNCHGGTYETSNHSVTGANFLPFDAQLFLYNNSNTVIKELAQRDIFRKLNMLIKNSFPTNSRITEQIDGWYQWCGGVDSQNCYLDDKKHPFTPSGWASAKKFDCPTPTGKLHVGTKGAGTKFYQQVSRKYCRTCHLARSGDFDVQDFAQAGLICDKLKPNLSTSNMPKAEATFNDYWLDIKAQKAFKDFFNF